MSTLELLKTVIFIKKSFASVLHFSCLFVGKGNRAKQSGRSIDPRDEAGRSSTRPSTPPALCNRKQGSKAITIPGSQSSQYSNGQASQVSVYSQAGIFV